MRVHREKRYKKYPDRRRSKWRMEKGRGKEGGEVRHLLLLCVSGVVIFSPVKDDRGLQTHKGKGEKD